MSIDWKKTNTIEKIKKFAVHNFLRFDKTSSQCGVYWGAALETACSMILQ